MSKKEKKKAMTKTRKFTIIIAIVAIIGTFYVANLLKENKQAEDYNSKIPSYVEVQKETMDLADHLGQDTPYPILYRNMKELMISGTNQSTAAIQAGNSYLQMCAIVWFAKENKVKLSEKKANQYIEKLIQSQKEADNYEKVKDAYDKAGINMEAAVQCSHFLYYSQYASSELKDWAVDQGKIKESEYSDYIADLVDKYKKTDEYKAKKKIVDNCTVFLKADKPNDVTALQKGDIFFTKK